MPNGVPEDEDEQRDTLSEDRQVQQALYEVVVTRGVQKGGPRSVTRSVKQRRSLDHTRIAASQRRRHGDTSGCC